MSSLEDARSAIPDAEALANFKQAARATWAAGDYPAVASRNIWDVGKRVVRHVGVRRGEDVIDVACGSGNAAIRAAQAGGNVVGVDLTPELFDAARELAEDSGVWVEWLRGDAEDLPFEDETFDVALSTFGCMFAPRHEVAAVELARVLRPDGRMAVTAWSPEGAVGDMFRMLSGFLPSPPDFAQPPILWGDEEYVRDIFEGIGMDLSFRRETVQEPPFASEEEALDFWTTKFGPVISAMRFAEEQGTWPELREQLADHLMRREPLEYLVILGRKR